MVVLDNPGWNEFGGGREIAKGREERICFPRRAIKTLHKGPADRLTGQRNPLHQIRRCHGVGDIEDILYINQVKHFFYPEKVCFINPYPSKNRMDNNWYWLSLNAGKIGYGLRGPCEGSSTTFACTPTEASDSYLAIARPSSHSLHAPRTHNVPGPRAIVRGRIVGTTRPCLT